MFYELSEQDNLVIKYLPLVRNIVSRIDSKNSVYELEDLVSIGVIGLMDAIKRYDYKKKVPFEAYATIRIRGAVIDELRKAGPVSRSRIDKLNRYYTAKEKLENKFFRTPKESEICKELDIDDKELSSIYETVHYLSNVSLESIISSKDGNNTELIDLIQDSNSISPEEHFTNKERRQVIKDAVDTLDEREKTILNLYYVEELSMKEIAYILDISIPRVSQIHGRILLKLRDTLGSYLEVH